VGDEPVGGATVLDVPGDRMSARQLYDVLRLRAEVFVVEQDCPYLDLDGADLDPTTRHLWIEASAGGPLATARVVDEGGAWRVGRVVTRPEARGSGLAARLVEHALATTGRPVLLSAQSHLAAWYADFGFVVDGPEFLEDGIPHTPMRLV
jgi:ElaA protein